MGDGGSLAGMLRNHTVKSVLVQNTDFSPFKRLLRPSHQARDLYVLGSKLTPKLRCPELSCHKSPGLCIRSTFSGQQKPQRSCCHLAPLLANKLLGERRSHSSSALCNLTFPLGSGCQGREDIQENRWPRTELEAEFTRGAGEGTG